MNSTTNEQITNDTYQETSNLRQILSVNFTFSKRQIGIILATIGILGLVSLFALDSLGMGRDAEIGPAQQIGFALAFLVTIAGLSIIPRGNKPF